MKKTWLFFLFAFLWLTGCYVPESIETSLPMENSADKYFENQQVEFFAWNGSVMCKIGNIYYYSLHNFMHFYDTKTGIHDFLCGKPECDHTDPKTCNAVLETENFLAAYDGWIYNVNYEKEEHVLFRISTDGAVRERVCTIPDPTGWNGLIALHQDAIYVSKTNQEVINGKPAGHFTFYCQKIGTEEPELIFAKEAMFIDRNHFLFVDDELYFSISYLDEMADGADYTRLTELWNYHVSSKEWELLWQGALPGNGQLESFWPKDGKLICGVLDWEQERDMILTFDIGKKEFEAPIYIGEEFLNLDVSEKYVITSGGVEYFYIFDHEGRQVGFYDLTPESEGEVLGPDGTFMGTDGDAVFVQVKHAVFDGEREHVKYAVYRLTPGPDAEKMDEVEIIGMLE